MKTTLTSASWLAGLCLMASPVLGQNYEQIAKQIVTTSAGVKPGELVLITGGQFTLPLMEGSDCRGSSPRRRPAQHGAQHR